MLLRVLRLAVAITLLVGGIGSAQPTWTGPAGWAHAPAELEGVLPSLVRFEARAVRAAEPRHKTLAHDWLAILPAGAMALSLPSALDRQRRGSAESFVAPSLGPRTSRGPPA